MDKEKRARLGGQRSLLFAASLTKEGISFVLMCGRKSLEAGCKNTLRISWSSPRHEMPGQRPYSLKCALFFFWRRKVTEKKLKIIEMAQGFAPCICIQLLRSPTTNGPVHTLYKFSVSSRRDMLSCARLQHTACRRAPPLEMKRRRRRWPESNWSGRGRARWRRAHKMRVPGDALGSGERTQSRTDSRSGIQHHGWLAALLIPACLLAPTTDPIPTKSSGP